MVSNNLMNTFPVARSQAAALPLTRAVPNSFGPLAPLPPPLADSVFVPSAIRAEQRYNEQQVARVAQAAVNLARALGLPPERQALIGLAARYYTVGKDFNDPVWSKPGPLTPVERQKIQSYPLASVNQMIAASADKRCQGLGLQADQLDKAIPLVLSHQFHYDGTGYPGQSIAGEQIPLEAQILGLVDAYYAMTASRPYRSLPLSPQAALQALLAESGTCWNPALVGAFVGKTI
jgi:putative two-component system response regulator